MNKKQTEIYAESYAAPCMTVMSIIMQSQVLQVTSPTAHGSDFNDEEFE